MRNVEYGKYHEPIYRTLEKFSISTGNQDIDIAAFQVNLHTLKQRTYETTFQALFPIIGYNSSQAAGRLLNTSVCIGTWRRCWYCPWRFPIYNHKK